jgi:predicted extracellular nuclease
MAFVCASLFCPAPHAPADTATPVTISEVYAGGGGVGASYRNDFVELFNRTRYTVDLTGWRIAYSPPRIASWTTMTLSGSVAPYRYYLVAFGSSGATGAPLPRPDAAGTTNLARSSGEVALVNRNPQRVDLVGYGPGADVFEGRPAPAATTNAQSVTRVPSPCTDTNRNDIDFRIKSPTPRNRASSGYACPW